ncbi:hypothetical protein RV18_GL001601 [Enterococcus termitis]|nr:hypothetical protein RV18_GL001601 [Enterococcus termitis]
MLFEMYRFVKKMMNTMEIFPSFFLSLNRKGYIKTFPF